MYKKVLSKFMTGLNFTLQPSYQICKFSMFLLGYQEKFIVNLLSGTVSGKPSYARSTEELLLFESTTRDSCVIG